MKINKLLESKKIKEDASYEWKPNTSFKHIKDIYNKVKDNDYKYVNNEREEFMAAVKKADRKGYKPEECKQIKDWHRDIWQHNRKVDESFKPSNGGIQSVKCYNRYNYTIQELRVDNDNKTFERGNFTAGKADKKVKNRQEYEDIVDSLKELGYTEIKSDYHSLRNKTRKGIPTNEATLPRNASKIRATHRYGDRQSMDLSKDGTYWREPNSNRAYPSDFLRRSFDIEVLETDPNYKPNRTKPEYVVQGNYGYGWEDLTSSDNQAEAKADLKAYRENELGVAHRLITRRVPVNESVDLNKYERDVESFLNKYGFNDERYPHITNSYNNTEETVVKVSFNDGISAKDYNVMKKHLGNLGADIYLANRHKDYSKDNELWSTIEFEFSNAPERESLKESNGDYYVTVYEETSKSGPEEGGYTSYGWEAAHSKKFNTLDRARKYLNDFADGAEVIYNSGDTMEIVDEYGDTYKLRIETEEDRGSSNSPAKSWAEAEMGVEFDKPFFDDEGKRLPEDPKVTAKREADREALKQEYVDKVNACTTKQEVMNILIDKKYDSLGDDFVTMAMNKYKVLKESKTVTRYAVEYYLDDDENRDTEYVYADSAKEARKIVKNKYKGCVITGCDSSEVPADYKRWDMQESHSVKVFGAKGKKLDEALHDFRFYVSCNDGPSKAIRTVAENEDKAIAYVKNMYAQEHSTYADDRQNKWSIKNMDSGNIIETMNESKEVSDVTQYRDELQKYLDAKTRPNNFFVNATFDNKLCVEITWGDWKHEHMACDWLVKEFFKSKGIEIDVDVEETESDGGDAYSATHYYDFERPFELNLVNESSNGFQKEFYDGYVILKNRAGDGWDIYSYDGTPEKVKKAYLEDEGYATIKDAKKAIDSWNDKAKLDEASYGGAFDIADDEFWTRDDINEFADEVIDNINEIFYKKYKVLGSWYEDGRVIVSIGDDDGNEYESSEKVNMRKIRKPSDLVKYVGEIVYDLRQQIEKDEKLNEHTAISSRYEFDDDTDDLTYYYDDEVFKDNLENSPYTEIASKQVPDSNGFMTDYTMYMNINTGEYVFVFGDKDIYTPEDGWFDWECETKEEAEEWFNSYNGFTDEDDDDSLNWMNEDAEESPVVHTKNDGSYLVASEDGYTAFNKDNDCVGHISATNDNEAKSKFNANKFDENLKK